MYRDQLNVVKTFVTGFSGSFISRKQLKELLTLRFYE